MTDALNGLEQVERTVGNGKLAAGDARVVRLSRTYDAPIEDVWEALTSPERITRWFMPISGDLHVGGHYQLEGNAGGEVLACEEPSRFRVTWVFGDPSDPANVSELEVRLSVNSADSTEFELEHTAVVPDDRWAQFGPGAVGVGWDGAVLGLSLLLAGGSIADPMSWMMSEEARAFYRASSEKWGQANVAYGADPAAAATAVKNTSEFYAPTESPATGATDASTS